MNDKFLHLGIYLFFSILFVVIGFFSNKKGVVYHLRKDYKKAGIYYLITVIMSIISFISTLFVLTV